MVPPNEWRKGLASTEHYGEGYLSQEDAKRKAEKQLGSHNFRLCSFLIITTFGLEEPCHTVESDGLLFPCEDHFARPNARSETPP